jgi:DNA invertase Pin-like site-specific DNA recombinase
MLAIYTRLSVESDSKSIEYQKREGIQFANELFLDYVLYDEGAGVSGTNDIDDRPVLSKLISDISSVSTKLSAVWMRNQDRLDRNSMVFYIFLDAVKKSNVSVYFGNKEELDFNDPQTLLNTSILSAFNAYYAGASREKIKRVLHDNAEKGKVWGVVAFGYKTSENQILFVDDEESKVVKLIFRLALKGWGGKRIATKLNIDGVPTRYNRYEGTLKTTNQYTKKVIKKSKGHIVWSAKTITDILKNEWYVGIRKYAGKTYVSPIIISDTDFYQVQELFKKRKNSRRVEGKHKYLLRGKIRCGCGRNYYGRYKKSGRDNYYMCSSKREASMNCGSASINIPRLDSFIIQHLFQSKNLLDHFEEVLNNSDKLKTLNYEFSQLSSNIATLNRKKNRYATLLGEELNGDETILNRYKKTNKELVSVVRQQTLIETKINDLSSRKGLINYKEIIKKFQNKELLNDFDSLQEAIYKIIDEIIIDSYVKKDKTVILKLKISYNNIELDDNENVLWIAERVYGKSIVKFEFIGEFENVQGMNYGNIDNSNDINQYLNNDVISYLRKMSSMNENLVKHLEKEGMSKKYIDKYKKFQTIYVDKKSLFIFNK